MDGAFPDDFGIKYPVTGSHEPAGTIVSLGEDAEKEERVKVGMRVAGSLHSDVCREYVSRRVLVLLLIGLNGR